MQARRPADVAARLLATAPMQARTSEALTDPRLISAEVGHALVKLGFEGWRQNNSNKSQIQPTLCS